MRVRTSVLALALALVPLVGCGKKAPEPVPTPTQAPPPTPPPATDDDAARRRADSLARAEADRLRALEAARAAVINELGQAIHFDYDRSDVQLSDQALLDRKAEILRANPQVRIRVAGHADDRGSDEYNLALGTRRAVAAKRYLVARGVDESRIEIISFGEERPIDPNQNESAWARNRRDEFEITAGRDSIRPVP